jgi:AsmA family
VTQGTKRRQLGIALLAALIFLSLMRPGAERLKSRIVRSLSLGIGRPVDVKTVHLQFLPPGFELNDLRVFDDPSFSNEPVLRAPEVTAFLRIRSLLRGRLELSRLELSDPSLNLVRNAEGGWNVKPLLERSARTPMGPTAAIAYSSRPAFPYIEATGARVNFKSGMEKKPYALLNADLSLWQDSDNSMSIRVKGVPVRTDVSLSDTGVVRMDATWQRAQDLREAPMRVTAQWDGGQLGQLTRLFTGTDEGWRGNAALGLEAHGTPADLLITLDASAADFRRYDIATGYPLGLSTHCTAHYDLGSHTVRDGDCNSVSGNGTIRIRGGSDGSSLDLKGEVEAVPAAAVAELARRVKAGLAADFAAAGSLDGEFTYHRSAQIAKLDGTVEIQNLRLSSASNDSNFALGNVALRLTSGADVGKSEKRDAHPLVATPSFLPTAVNRLEFGPVTLPLGGGAPATLQGRLTLQEYELALRGEAAVARALRMARMLGLPTPQSEMQGLADGHLNIGGPWRGSSATPGFEPAGISGTVGLHQFRFAWSGRPIEMSAAEIAFQPAHIHVSRIEATAAGTRWTGTVDRARGCSAAKCTTTFDLAANEIDPGRIRAWIAPAAAKLPWYAFLQSNAHANSEMPNFQASGEIHVRQVIWRQWTANDASAHVEVGEGKLTLSNLKASLFGGTHQGTWTADYSVKPAVVEGKGTFASVRFAEFKQLLHDDKLSLESGNAGYEIKASGSGPAGADYKISGVATLGRQKCAISGTLAEPKVNTAADQLEALTTDGAAEHRSLTPPQR